MRIGMVGLGRMGMNMTKRLLKGKHEIVAYDHLSSKVRDVAKTGAQAAKSLEELVSSLRPPRVVWLMLPAGDAVDKAITYLRDLLGKGDIIIDGGNSFYKDDLRRNYELKPYGIHYVDVGVSGGIWGLKSGYCLMIGGERKIFRRLEPLFKTLAPEKGHLYCGPSGAGHFVKMVHNGIEYGMMSSYGEGFELLYASPYAECLDFSKVADLWNRGSVIRSWLLELAVEALRKKRNLSDIEPYIEDSGEGRWMVNQAVESAVPIPVITAALYQRFRSRGKNLFSDRLLAALRREFGGHEVKKKKR